MADNNKFTEIQHISFGSRILDSLKGLIFGFLFILISMAVLYWNEGRAIRNYEGLKEGLAIVGTVNPQTVSPQNNSKLIHFHGVPTASSPATDPIFTVSASALRISRKVKTLMWQEVVSESSKSQIGGSKEVTKTYTYELTWSEYPIDSKSFKHPEGHTNPPMAYRSETYNASQINVGNFSLPDMLISKLTPYNLLPITENNLVQMDANIRRNIKVRPDGLFIGNDFNHPKAGDTMINFYTFPLESISVVGRQIGSTIEPFHTKAGSELFFISRGALSAEAMFAHEEKVNGYWTWGIRIGAFLFMLLGFCFMGHPLVVIADIIPIFGGLMNAGVFFASFILSGILSLFMIGIGWLAHRPVIGAAFLLGSFVLAMYAMSLKRTKINSQSQKRVA
jgi:hypothetical protein